MDHGIFLEDGSAFIRNCRVSVNITAIRIEGGGETKIYRSRLHSQGLDRRAIIWARYNSALDVRNSYLTGGHYSIEITGDNDLMTFTLLNSVLADSSEIGLNMAKMDYNIRNNIMHGHFAAFVAVNPPDNEAFFNLLGNNNRDVFGTNLDASNIRVSEDDWNEALAAGIKKPTIKKLR